MATMPLSPNAISPSRWRRLPGELLARERRLARYGFVLLALLVPLALAWALDDRVLRDANVWIKPFKFTLSVAVLALTTAWFVGHLPAARRTHRSVDWIVGLLMGSGTFELVYITLQAALGQASHYNETDLLHTVMYTLMGIGALVLTATQPMLAWQLHRHPDATRPRVYRHAVLLGLVLTFVLGAGAGMLLGNRPPASAGATLPVLGWSLAGGDLRPAHFVGIHAEQLLPFIAQAALAARLRRPAWAAWVMWGFAGVYMMLFGALAVWGLAGRH